MRAMTSVRLPLTPRFLPAEVRTSELVAAADRPCECGSHGLRLALREPAFRQVFP
jgi:hypothetical protein